MVQIWFPGLKFNGAALTEGQLLNIWLLSVNIKIPPWDVTLIGPVEFWKPFLVFDSDWVVKPISTAVNAIPKAVWELAKSTMDSWADAFYKKHCTYEEYVKEREQKQQEK